MSFSLPKFGILTLTFSIFVFVIVLIYYLIRPKKYRWISLLIFSLSFYILIDWKGLLFLLPTSIIVYIFSILIAKFRFNEQDKKYKDLDEFDGKSNKKQIIQKSLLILAIVLIGGILFILKYFNFIGTTISNFVNKPWTVIDFIIPLGLSYYTFQSIAYLVDVKKEKTDPIKNPLKLILFLSFFPIISMGPISRANQICKELFEGNTFDSENLWSGIKRILFGYLKKVAIADIIAIPVAFVFKNHAQYYGIPLILAAIGYAIQIYCDFSGCVDISLGVATLFGINLPENFDRPYTSPTLQIFWRKWHMTLTSWFKDYIYIPLGGNRVKIPRYILNIMVVWLFTGIWHGANWTFIIWGLYNGVLLICAALFRRLKSNLEQKYANLYKNKFITFLRIVRTLALVCIGWVIFNSSSVRDAMRYLYHCAFFWRSVGLNDMFSSLPIGIWIGLFLIIVACVTLYTPMTGREGYIKNISFKFSPAALPFISMIIFTIVVLARLYQFSTGNGSNSFVYSNF